MFARALPTVFLAACWTSSGGGTPAVKETTPTKSPTTERRATLRIDAEPGGKNFQGVWLELADGKRWVVDYRPRDFWKSFEDKEVIVTGGCYKHDPRVQAISSQHFRVDTMKFVTPKRGFGPILELWPEQELRGKFVAIGAPAGSKREGSSEMHFIDDGGKDYFLQGWSVDKPEPKKPVWICARGVTPDMSFVAQTGGDGPKLWILEVQDHDYVSEATCPPTPVDCPE
jgi:hypothetical protein